MTRQAVVRSMSRQGSGPGYLAHSVLAVPELGTAGSTAETTMKMMASNQTVWPPEMVRGKADGTISKDTDIEQSRNALLQDAPPAAYQPRAICT